MLLEDMTGHDPFSIKVTEKSWNHMRKLWESRFGRKHLV